MSIGILPAVWDASIRKGTPRSLQSRPISLTGWTVPITLEAWFTTTRRVFFRKSFPKSSGSTKPAASKGT